MEEEQEAVRGILDTTKAQAMIIETLQEDHSTQSGAIEQKARDTFQQKYMDYEPSGNTPVRCDTDVPSKVAIESLRAMPMETLLEEFRENHSFELSEVKEAEPFNGSFPVLGSPTAISDKAHQKCAATDQNPSKLKAETPCKLLRYLVSDGSHVDADTPYAEVEVMKMCMLLLSPASGVIQFKMSKGQAMQVGELIARLALDDASAVRKAEPFNGSFPVLRSPTAISDKVHQKCTATLSAGSGGFCNS